MSIKYVARDTAPLYAAVTGTKKLLELLWGDRLTLLEPAGAEGRQKVRARGRTGFVAVADLGDTSLLEIYFIDVGQGDGILVRTPDHRHIMIDGGDARGKQPTGKNAADFVDWKFAKDYGEERIHLDAMIASHNDADHYGGLADLLDVAQNDELDAGSVTVENFYHAGVAWWVHPAGDQRWLGPVSADKAHLTQLMGSRTRVMAALKPAAQPRLQGEWAAFLGHVVRQKRADGRPTPITRLSHRTGMLPGFAGEGGLSIRVLAPVETRVEGRPALRNFGSSAGKNTNGNSVLLRLDYGRARILLTGDLNSDSQRALLDDYAGRRVEFQCDVAKACHHGSEDVSYEFLAAMRPAVTIISSGDNEGHDHPRPGIVAASATTGHLQIDNDRVVSPLIYSTELARSISLGKPVAATVSAAGGASNFGASQLGAIEVQALVRKPGNLNPQTVRRTLDRASIVAGLIYGLVNVRTDGETILCATLNEKDHTWQVKKLRSRF